jgi:hypothetical protein
MWTGFTPTLPNLYWDVDSHEERIKRLCMELHKLLKYADYLGDNINLDHETIQELQDAFDKFMESGFDNYYAEQIAQWVDDNLGYIFERYTRGVYFGLTLDGHFVAYIPESWNDIVFDTGADYTLDTYGRLILRMDVDSPYDADQRPEVVRPYTDANLEEKVRNIMNTLYATGGFTNG